MKNLTKTVSFCIIVILSIINSSCNLFKEEIREDTSFSKEILEIVPQSTIDELRDSGMDIHEGNRPPNVEGLFLLDPTILVRDFGTSGMSPGFQFDSYFFRFFEQEDNNRKIKTNYNNINQYCTFCGEESGLGNRAYVSGTENFFTIFSEVKAVNITNSNQIVTWTGLRIISGEITSTGIRNWQHYLNMKAKDGDSNGELIRTCIFRRR